MQTSGVSGSGVSVGFVGTSVDVQGNSPLAGRTLTDTTPARDELSISSFTSGHDFPSLSLHERKCTVWRPEVK